MLALVSFSKVSMCNVATIYFDKAPHFQTAWKNLFTCSSMLSSNILYPSSKKVISIKDQIWNPKNGKFLRIYVIYIFVEEFYMQKILIDPIIIFMDIASFNHVFNENFCFIIFIKNFDKNNNNWVESQCNILFWSRNKSYVLLKPCEFVNLVLLRPCELL